MEVGCRQIGSVLMTYFVNVTITQVNSINSVKNVKVAKWFMVIGQRFF